MPTSKQRREAARRHLERQLARRRESEARRKRITAIVSGVVAVAVIAVVVSVILVTNGSDSKSAAGTTTCAFVSDGSTPARTVGAPPSVNVSAKGVVNVAVKTTQGDMTFELDRAEAPCTVENFISLFQQKYYDNTPCHRLTSGQLNVLQCGDPTGTGTGGPGYTIPDELHGTEKYTKGVLAMAKTSNPNSGGSQFFINYADSTLPADYTVFGKVTAGLDVVEKVAAQGTLPGSEDPLVAISISSMAIITGTPSSSSSSSSSPSATTTTS